MITEKDLLREIEECQKHPITDKKFERLASCFIIQDHLFGSGGYSYDDRPKREVEKIIETTGDTDFLRLVNGMKSEQAWEIMDDLMEVLYSTNQRLYNSVINKLHTI
jgi:hypothetical protein